MVAPTGEASRGLVVVLLAAALLLFAVVLSLQSIDSFDYWWQLRTGALILETGAVPTVDPYTYTVPGARWIDIHWIHQLALHAIHWAGGHEAVVLAQAACVVALIAVLAPVGWRRERAWLTALALGWLLVIASPRIMPRPELPSFVLLAAVVALLDRFERRGDAWVYAVIPVQIVWVNVHGLFALGLATLAIVLAGELARPLAGARIRRVRVRRLSVVLTLSAFASLLNPNGLDAAVYPFQQLGMLGPPQFRGAFGHHIDELLPLFGRRSGASTWHIAVVLGLAATSGLAIAANSRRRLSDPLLWGAFLYLGVTATRNVALFAIVAAPLLIRNANEWFDEHSPVDRLHRLAAAAVIAILAWLSFDVVNNRFYPRIGTYREFGLGIAPEFYPSGAADWIERERPGGPIFHRMQDGGYLLWRLYPSYRSMGDGRLEVFGLETLASLQVQSPERFAALDQQYRFGVVLLNHSRTNYTALLRNLQASDRWKLAFVDDVAAIFVRASAPGATDLPVVDLDAADLFPSLSGESRSDRDRMIARINLFTALGRHARAFRLWEATAARDPDFPGREIVGVRLALRAGRHDAAETLIQTALDTHPHDAHIRVQLADSVERAGDLFRAAGLREQARALDPELRSAMTQKQRDALRESRRSGIRWRRWVRRWMGSFGAESVVILCTVGLLGLVLRSRRGQLSPSTAEVESTPPAPRDR